jgi:hypothetical protein
LKISPWQRALSSWLLASGGYGKPGTGVFEGPLPDDSRPYRIETACKTPDPRFLDINRYEKMFAAVIGAKALAQVAYDQRWTAKQHDDVARIYLGLQSCKRASYAEVELVRDNLYGVSKLAEGVPFLASFWIEVRCTDTSNKCNKLVESTVKRVAAYANETTGGWFKICYVVLCEP